MLKSSIATCKIVGTSPMTQSRQHDAPKLEGENPNDYDARTWRHKLNVNTDRSSIVIRAHGMHQCIAAAAKYSKRQIPGQGKATWTAKFNSGLIFWDNPEIDVHPDSVAFITVSANADGVRGSGKRVPRRFPIIPAGWTSTFDVSILDPIITEQVFAEMLNLAGLFIGVGQFRPEKGGTNGRFRVESIKWEDNRDISEYSRRKMAA